MLLLLYMQASDWFMFRAIIISLWNYRFKSRVIWAWGHPDSGHPHTQVLARLQLWLTHPPPEQLALLRGEVDLLFSPHPHTHPLLSASGVAVLSQVPVCVCVWEGACVCIVCAWECGCTRVCVWSHGYSVGIVPCRVFSPNASVPLCDWRCDWRKEEVFW